MLSNLLIKNVAIIDELNIEFGAGLNVLTGETGAGKSIIIDSINAILGDRVSKELIRTGQEKARVEAIFYIDNSRMEDIFLEFSIESEPDGMLILSREFSINGKNVCKINNSLATVSVLKKIGRKLIDMHGQNDNQSLLRVESHIELLDLFAGEKFQILKKEYLSKLTEYKELKSRIDKLFGNTGERERKIDLLKFQIDEILSAALKHSEEEELDKQRTILSNSEKIISSLSDAYENIFLGDEFKLSAIDSISRAISCIQQISSFDPKYETILNKLHETLYQLEDLGSDIKRERDNIDFEPGILEKIEERLDFIFRLKRKYGNSIKDILEYFEKIQSEVNELENSEELANALSNQLEQLDNELYLLCVRMNIERNNAAQTLESSISRELYDLEMKNSKFRADIVFEDKTRNYTLNGLNKVEFMISTNSGEPLKSMSKIASGGEMSRIMLAIKTILAKEDQIPTLIFDEVDTGISGKAAQKVAEKLSYISTNHQTICVTHLAQIACMADNNYFIEKSSFDEITTTKVKKLDEPELNKEIARIIGGGNISEITLKHAQEMIYNARR